MNLAIKPSARRDMLKLPDAVLVKAFRVILALAENPYPRGVVRVKGSKGHLRVWIDRDHRIIYKLDKARDRLDILYVGRKEKGIYDAR